MLEYAGYGGLQDRRGAGLALSLCACLLCQPGGWGQPSLRSTHTHTCCVSSPLLLLLPCRSWPALPCPTPSAPLHPAGWSSWSVAPQGWTAAACTAAPSLPASCLPWMRPARRRWRQRGRRQTHSGLSCAPGCRPSWWECRRAACGANLAGDLSRAEEGNAVSGCAVLGAQHTTLHPAHALPCQAPLYLVTFYCLVVSSQVLWGPL